MSVTKGNILIVDDTPANLNVLSAMLTEKGYRVRPAINGDIALKAVSKLLPDLILLDIHMPGMTGYEVCQKLKADALTSDIPVIFISASDEVLDKVKAFAVGGLDYITKPFQLEEVLARVENQLNLRHLQKQVSDRNTQLQLMLQDLQQAQSQLVQSAKMSSLGQLVAGIAHEINNPVSFIQGNVTHASGYVQDLLELLRLYQNQFPQSTPEIQEWSERNDLEFIQEDLLKLLLSMQVGTERIYSIVRLLRTFSHLDEAELKTIDLHAGIDSTLMLLGSRLRGIQVIQQYGDLPKILCYAGQLNQVFMHLLNNAIDALRDRIEAEVERNIPLNSFVPTLQIQTTVVDRTRILIRVIDNGVGMTDVVKARIFDPFFTTKPVGRGIGLGLSISYQVVVEKHGGSLNCASIPGQGSEFAIELPWKEQGLTP